MPERFRSGIRGYFRDLVGVRHFVAPPNPPRRRSSLEDAVKGGGTLEDREGARTHGDLASSGGERNRHHHGSKQHS